MKKTLQKILYPIVALSILLTVVLPLPATAKPADPQPMEVHFLDVGQGDSTLVTCDGHAMLIDAGDDTKGTAIQNYLQKQNIKKLDYLILTHPDADHIGGAPVIITKFEISKVFVSNFEKDNKTYRKLMQALDEKRLNTLTPSVNSRYSLGTASFTILAPNDTYDTPNNASIALLLQNGENTFLFTGDAEAEAEQDILENGIDISADVYKVGHHGSRSSTSQKFFKAVDPDYAVISCGEGNSYGHPHAETLNTLRTNGVSVYRTDEDGTIIASADGKVISFNVPASETWKAGEPAGSPSKTELTYVLNVKTKKFHRPSCNSLPTANRLDSSESRENIIAQGYAPCKRCNP
ncbi:MAG: MBL fold metallo-hydrolase [Bacteroidales bacterium]|nr:MBL fold metallo-hydrolase [Bacteroidales bacterium]MCM1416960.1 MBL fold metallo-hydrolase [bacterium]MCM1424035.1 MBL fold metallo-hydrolase [bacterium]